MRRITRVSFAELCDSSADRAEFIERYDFLDGAVVREVELHDGNVVRSDVKDTAGTADAFSAFWRSWLASPPPSSPVTGGRVTVADLFSGCGGLSVGIREACRALGLNETVELSVDVNEPALAVFEQNFAPTRTHQGPIEQLVDGDLGDRLTTVERKLARDLAGLTVAVGGPPCQGHSDLNNHTRRRDPKNALYLRMARFVEVVRPEHVIIENVPGVVHDRSNVVARARRHLEDIGYHVTDGVLSVDRLGWAQRRRRHVMLASLSARTVDVRQIEQRHARQPLPVTWALDGAPHGLGVFHTSATHSRRNAQRIQYLFDNDLYELPDHQRPDCHRLKPHSYKSVYGRMRPDEPAPTITSGFGSTGQGRFVHPSEQRTLSPHEAARVQGFPDWFDFSAAPGRRALQEMIGNAVPSRLGYVAALELLR